MDLTTRVKNILIAPKREWPVIAEEPADVASVYTGYIMPLAAIPPVCSVIGLSVVGMMGYRMGFGVALGWGITRYVLSLVAIYVAAFIARKLAPTFGGRDNLVQGLKLIAYSATASWVGGVFGLIPMLSILGVLTSLYSLYLLFTGAAVVMSVPEDRAVGYSAAVIIATIGVFLILFWLAATIAGHSMMM
jgi:Yip1-like protein